MKVPTTCPECGKPFPFHDLSCYHADCDEDDFALHGCGLSEGMTVIVSDPKNFNSQHQHRFIGTVDGVHHGTDGYVVIVDQEDEYFCVDFDEIEEVEPE